jgi:hypothetical protein
MREPHTRPRKRSTDGHRVLLLVSFRPSSADRCRPMLIPTFVSEPGAEFSAGDSPSSPQTPVTDTAARWDALRTHRIAMATHRGHSDRG